MENDEVAFDVEKHMKQDIPVDSLVCIYYLDGTARTGKLVEHKDGKCVLENVDAKIGEGITELTALVDCKAIAEEAVSLAVNVSAPIDEA